MARTVVSVLGRAMTDEDVPTSVRVRAALSFLATLPSLSARAELERP
ncbi:hypothetical protein [Streptomyces sp. Vc17.3-30]|nr:hypothetical protein [Streptomyces sp. Vc17.3-30]MCO6698860.1 hypothetical protein [Streptomyces sp. Vc17.3-30]